MAIPSVAGSANGISASAGTTADASLTITAGSNRLLLAFPGGDDSDTETNTITSVVLDPGGGDEASFTYASIRARNVYSTNRNALSEVWYLKEANFPATGTYTVRATISEAGLYCWVGVSQIDDVDQTTPLGNSNTSTGNGVPTASVTTGDTNSLVFGGVGSHGNNSGNTPGSGVTEVWDNGAGSAGGGSDYLGGHRDAASTGSYTIDWTGSTGQYAEAIVEVREVDAGGPTLAALRLLRGQGR